jgi:hypothetical protein
MHARGFGSVHTRCAARQPLSSAMLEANLFRLRVQVGKAADTGATGQREFSSGTRWQMPSQWTCINYVSPLPLRLRPCLAPAYGGPVRVVAVSLTIANAKRCLMPALCGLGGSCW